MIKEFKGLTKNKAGNHTVGMSKYYQNYSSNFKTKTPKVSKKVFGKVVQSLFKKVWYHIIVGKVMFSPLVSKFGLWSIEKTKRKEGFYIDWKATKEKGRIVKSYNFATMGQIYFIKWDKSCIKKGNRLYYYIFTPNRGSDTEEIVGSRGLSRHINNCYNDPDLKDYEINR